MPAFLLRWNILKLYIDKGKAVLKYRKYVTDQVGRKDPHKNKMDSPYQRELIIYM